MIPSINYENIIITLGSFLDTYSGINPNRILNADSVRGTDLGELISSTESYSPTLGSSFVLFELLESTEDDNFVTKDENETNMITIQNYNFHLMIYGNSSPNDAQKLSALFKQSNNALMLRDKGIYIRGVSRIEPNNEFINNTLILRRDLFIRLECKNTFEKIGKDVGYFDDSQNIDIIVNRVVDIN